MNTYAISVTGFHVIVVCGIKSEAKDYLKSDLSSQSDQIDAFQSKCCLNQIWGNSAHYSDDSRTLQNKDIREM